MINIEENANEYLLVNLCTDDRGALSVTLFKIPSGKHGQMDRGHGAAGWDEDS